MTAFEMNHPHLWHRHYVRNATAWNHWFDLYAGVVDHYLQRFGEDFCIVIVGSRTHDDTFVLPYALLRRFLTKVGLDSRRRWVGTIVDGQFRLTRGGVSIPVDMFRNAFGLLAWFPQKEAAA